MSSLKPIIETLEEGFQKLNERFFEGTLEKPVITVSPDTTSGAFGWATRWRAWQEGEGEGEGHYEINICAEHLNRPFVEVMETMLHEMIHIYNLHAGVKDCSRGGTYHNKRFKTEAEKRGLIVTQSEKYGYAHTKANPETIEFINSMDCNGFQLHRTKQAKAEKGCSRKSSSRKYQCPCCGMIIRATKEVKIFCGECTSEELFIEMELQED